MAKNDSHRLQGPPLLIVRGQQEPASYKKQLVPEYKGNPLIEALPPIWTRAEVTRLLAQFPPYNSEQRRLPAHLRLHLIENAREFFIPQGIHLEIEMRISCMLRRGLQQRNPVEWSYWSELNDRVSSLQAKPSGKVFLPLKARGFAIVGISGMGKTTAVANILSLYPQVIVHGRYKQKDLILQQIVWLKLDCPLDGSTKGLCLNFFQAVDDILGTNYYERYTGGGQRTVDDLLPRMARVASLHCLGVLVIDEIQNLSEARSGGSARMLNFFVQLENTIGVPFILIGTPKAIPVLSGEFRQARRATEQGDVYWERMKDIVNETGKAEDHRVDPVWEEFIRALWAYQYLRQNTSLKTDLSNDPLSHAIYDESQGITAIAVTLYLLAQRRAINSDTEKITVGLIRSVARDSQHLIGPMLNQLKLEGHRRSHDISNLSDLDTGALTSERTLRGRVADAAVTLSKSSTSKASKRKADLASLFQPAAVTGQSRRRKKAAPDESEMNYAEDDLRRLGIEAEKTNPAEILRRSRHIRSAVENFDK
jgi:AAA domain-containing protein